jgi:hypothetical protein
MDVTSRMFAYHVQAKHRRLVPSQVATKPTYLSMMGTFGDSHSGPWEDNGYNRRLTSDMESMGDDVD